MGFARKDPGAFSLDLSSSTTFSSASLSGTSNCEDWNFSTIPTTTYVAAQWEPLSEAAARGKGTHLDALAQLMGCPKESHSLFSMMMHEHYSNLFSLAASVKNAESFVKQITFLIQRQNSFSCVIPLPPINSSHQVSTISLNFSSE